MKHLNVGDMLDFLVPLPSRIEQTAIAEVLSDMDAELSALERRREKTQALKQGMMQELLTGKNTPPPSTWKRGVWFVCVNLLNRPISKKADVNSTK